jgi:hypothetical protein
MYVYAVIEMSQSGTETTCSQSSARTTDYESKRTNCLRKCHRNSMHIIELTVVHTGTKGPATRCNSTPSSGSEDHVGAVLPLDYSSTQSPAQGCSDSAQGKAAPAQEGARNWNGGKKILMSVYRGILVLGGLLSQKSRTSKHQLLAMI